MYTTRINESRMGVKYLRFCKFEQTLWFRKVQVANLLFVVEQNGFQIWNQHKILHKIGWLDMIFVGTGNLIPTPIFTNIVERFLWVII